MAAVDFRIKNLKAADGTKATLAEVTGSIDATSIVQFQNVMDKLVEKGVRNLILDCANVKYINSTGLGTLLKYVDTFESMDGHIAFTRVPSKVMLVMEMLGFNALFTIVPDEAAALRQFGGRPAAQPPVPPTPLPTAQAAPPAQPSITPAAAPTINRPAQAAPSIAQPKIRPASPAPAPAAAAGPAGYPTAVDCARCRLTLDVSAPGKYKCPRCESVLVAEPNGKPRFFAPKKSRPVSVSLPAQPDLLDGLGPLIEGAAKQAGFNGATIGSISTAVITATKGVAELAYSGDASSAIHLLMTPEESAFIVHISDYGKPIAAGSNGAPQGGGFDEVTKLMDEVQVKPNPKGGNLVTMTKRLG